MLQEPTINKKSGLSRAADRLEVICFN